MFPVISPISLKTDVCYVRAALIACLSALEIFCAARCSETCTLRAVRGSAEAAVLFTRCVFAVLTSPRAAPVHAGKMEASRDGRGLGWWFQIRPTSCRWGLLFGVIVTS